jgi:hypothetical protein
MLSAEAVLICRQNDQDCVGSLARIHMIRDQCRCWRNLGPMLIPAYRPPVVVRLQMVVDKCVNFLK